MNRQEIIQEILETMSNFKRLSHNQAGMIADCPVSFAHLELLFMVQANQPTTAKQLAEKLRMTPGAISQFVEGLEQHKLIERRIDPSDRRVQYVHVTKSGSKLLRDIQKHRRQRMERVMQDLTDDELVIWLRVQQKFIEQIQTDILITNKGANK